MVLLSVLPSLEEGTKGIGMGQNCCASVLTPDCGACGALLFSFPVSICLAAPAF